MTQEIVDEALRRYRVLMSPERAGEWIEVEPEETAESLGALAAVGFEATDQPVRGSVYVIPDRAKQAEVSQSLSAARPDTDLEATTVATNGPMLFFGHADVSGPDGIKAQFRLARLVSAFSGDE